MNVSTFCVRHLHCPPKVPSSAIWSSKPPPAGSTAECAAGRLRLVPHGGWFRHRSVFFCYDSGRRSESRCSPSTPHSACDCEEHLKGQAPVATYLVGEPDCELPRRVNLNRNHHGLVAAVVQELRKRTETSSLSPYGYLAAEKHRSEQSVPLRLTPRRPATVRA